MRVRLLTTVEYTRPDRPEVVKRQLSADAIIQATAIQGIIRLVVFGETEDFHCECRTFSIGPTVGVEE